MNLPVRFYVEQSPNGTWRVMLRGEYAPVSVHDTEEEARERLAAYLRGVTAQGEEPATRGAGPPSSGPTPPRRPG